MSFKDSLILGAWCPECGPQLFVDEDGLCRICGATTTGDGANEALKNAVMVMELKQAAERWLEAGVYADKRRAKDAQALMARTVMQRLVTRFKLTRAKR